MYILDDKQIAKIRKLYNQGLTIAIIAERMGTGKNLIGDVVARRGRYKDV